MQSTDSSTDTLQTRRKWHEIVKIMKSKELKVRLLYSGRLSFKIEVEMKFSQKRTG